VNVGVIVGGVVGGVLGLAFVVLLGILVFRRRNSNHVGGQYPGPAASVEPTPMLGYHLRGSTMATSGPLMSSMNAHTISGPAQSGGTGAGYPYGYKGDPEV